MSTEIIMPEQRRQVVAPISNETNIMAVISRAAADPSCDIDKLERLMAMHERMQAREADLEHKKQINRAALDAFIEGGMTEECAKQAITLIAQRKIPAISISY